MYKCILLYFFIIRSPLSLSILKLIHLKEPLFATNEGGGSYTPLHPHVSLPSCTDFICTRDRFTFINKSIITNVNQGILLFARSPRTYTNIKNCDLFGKDHMNIRVFQSHILFMDIIYMYITVDSTIQRRIAIRHS